MSVAASSRTVPWRLSDLLVLYLCNLIAVVLLVIAWLEASGSVSMNAQLPWLDAAIAAVILAAGGNTLWLLVGRRNVGQLRRRLTPSILAETEPPDATRPTRVRLVAAADMTRYHRSDCLLVEGKDVTAARRAVHQAEGRRPCDICLDGER